MNQMRYHPPITHLLKAGCFALVRMTLFLAISTEASSANAQLLERVAPPAPSPPLDPPPEAPASPEDLFPQPSPAQVTDVLSPEVLATEIVVTDLIFENNTILDSNQLQGAILRALDQNFTNLQQLDCSASSPSPEWMPTAQTVAQLLQFSEVVALCYANAGYTTSGAIVQIGDDAQDGEGPVVIEVIEGALEAVQIAGTQRLNQGYVRSRLRVIQGQPLNVLNLQENLQLLQLDPLIQSVRAELNAGGTPGNSRLTVAIEEARSFNTSLVLDNSRPPSVGTTQGQIFLREGNLFGLGDSLSLGYTNSRGSDALSAQYRLPINPDGGVIDVRIDPTWNDIVDSDFFDLDGDDEGPDIESRSQLYEISLRQPLIRMVKGQQFQEFSLGLIGSLRNSQSFLFGQPFPLSPGASIEGKTRVSAIGFFQDYTVRDAEQIFSARSQFNVGLDIFDATVNSAVPGAEAIPDSRFFSWRGQMQWVKVLAPETLLLLRGNVQLSDQSLLSSEQFGIGGISSVRGYRQDQLLTDNGLFASAELRLPLARYPEWDGVVQVAPFMDFGTGWNSGRDTPDDSTLASLGLGLQLLQGDANQFSARLDWGIPLISVESGEDTWQESGVYFSIVYNPF